MDRPAFGERPSDRIEVMFGANPPYFQHMAVAAVSLLENTPDVEIRIHLLTCERDPEAEALLRRTFDRYPRLTLEIVELDGEALDRFFVEGFLTKECYLRILAPEILPRDIGRIIYLDCDLVVVDDLRPLWQLDLQGKSVAAAMDYPRVSYLVEPERLARLGMPAGAPYVNSGVLVIDLGRWRERGLTRRLFDFIEQKGSALLTADQDAINVVLNTDDDLTILDCRWNLQTRIYRVGRRSAPEDYEATRAARRKPAVLHYTGSEKPWLFMSGAALRRHYFTYLAATAWNERARPDRRWLRRLERRIDTALLDHTGIDYLHVAERIRRLPRKVAAGLRVSQAT